MVTVVGSNRIPVVGDYVVSIGGTRRAVGVLVGVRCAEQGDLEFEIKRNDGSTERCYCVRHHLAQKISDAVGTGLVSAASFVAPLTVKTAIRLGKLAKLPDGRLFRTSQ